MATEATVTMASAECNPVVSTAADSFVWQPNSLNMHVLRPKSAKGRTRPSLHKPQGAGACFRCAPSPLPPAIPCESPSDQKPGTCAPRSPSQGAPEEVPERLQQVPIGASSSLNKYPVLPSINRKSLEAAAVAAVAEKAGSLQLSSMQTPHRGEACTAKKGKEDSRAPVRSPEKEPFVQTRRQSPSGDGVLEEPSDQEPRLLLAVRSPSGRRFVRHFRPTDDLQTIVAVAEHKNKTTYRRCSIETMEVPRRRFSDLTKSLQECRIPHKSVLGISQEDGEGWVCVHSHPAGVLGL